MNGSHGMYFESTSARSPPSGQRHQVQTLRRQPSSRFDAYGPLPGSGIYGKDEHSNASNAPRFNDRMNATLHAGYGGYNMDGPAAWSDSNYAPGNNFASTLGSRMKPVARGRTALPSVCQLSPAHLALFSPAADRHRSRHGSPMSRHSSHPTPLTKASEARDSAVCQCVRTTSL